MQIVESPHDRARAPLFLAALPTGDMTLVILSNLHPKFNLRCEESTSPAAVICTETSTYMSEATKLPSKGSDWTRLLTDPDLASHLGKLLKTYREVSPEQRETALLRAMREIKDAAVKHREAREHLPASAAPA